jgi:hypothetical protein
MKAKNARLRVVGGVIVGLLIIGFGWWQTSRANSPAAQLERPSAVKLAKATPLPTSPVVRYQGVDGRTVFELLESKALVSFTGVGAATVVTSINGQRANELKKQYWTFMVNGQPSDTPADRYTTKASDVIEWKIMTY